MALPVSRGRNMAPGEKKGNIAISSSQGSSTNGSAETLVPSRERGKRADVS